MSYTLQLPTTIVNDAKLYASSCGTSLGHLVKMYIIELSTRKPDLKKRKLGIAEGECRIPTEAKSWGYSRLEYPQFSGAGANHTLENIG